MAAILSHIIIRSISASVQKNLSEQDEGGRQAKNFLHINHLPLVRTSLRNSSPGNDNIRILLVEDRAEVRAGLRMWLGSQPDFQIVGEAGTGAEALQLTQALKPDIIIMDYELPDQNGIETTTMIRNLFPQQIVIMLSIYSRAQLQRQAMEAGVTSFVEKSSGPLTLAETIRQAWNQARPR